MSEFNVTQKFAANSFLIELFRVTIVKFLNCLINKIKIPLNQCVKDFKI